MPGKLREKAVGTSINLQEEHIGTAVNEICYPRIQSCISLTVLGPHGLTGAHITAATEIEIVQDILNRMSAKSPLVAYIVGGIGEYKAKTKVPSLNTRKKLEKAIKSAIKGISNVYFYDTWAHSPDVNLRAEKNGTTVKFAWTQGVPVNWDIAPDMSNYAPIPPSSIVKR